MKFKKIKIDVGKHKIVDVVSDALIYQRNVCDGKAIPHIIISTEQYPEIEKSIALHKDVKEGEVIFTWTMSTDRKYVFLMMDSKAPVEISYIVRFDLFKHCGVIDRILSAKLMFIQAGKDGQRLLNTPDAPKLLLEVPHTGFENEWKKIYRKIQEKRFRNLGVKEKDLDEVISLFNKEWERVVNKHFK